VAAECALRDFFRAIAGDPRIGISHISLYCAFYQYQTDADPNAAISFVKSDIMKEAKISGLATFHKCIRDLHEYGYIRYRPSYDHRKKNRVYLVKGN